MSQTVWALRAHQCEPFNIRIFNKLAEAVPEQVQLVLALNNKSDADQTLVTQWKAVLQKLSRDVTIVTLPDDQVKQKYPQFEGGWRDGQVHMTEIGARLNFKFNHLWMSDHDLDFSGDFNTFWNLVKNDPRDHLTTWVRHHDLEPEWGWWPAVPKNKRLWRSFLPIIRSSQRLLRHMEQQLTTGKQYFCEAMLPSETTTQYGELALAEIPPTTFQHKYFRYHPPLNDEELDQINKFKDFRFWHPCKK